MVAELLAIASALVVAVAEILHARRVRRLARLAFGPTETPSAWARSAPALRVVAASATAWGLATLLVLKPKPHVAETLPENQRRNVVLILDVSPSMRLKDAGPNRDQTRRERSTTVMESFFQRVPIEQYLLSVVAFYSGAKPVVVGTRDMEVVRNILADLPMQFAFPVGKTDLFAGLLEAERIARPFQPKSTLLLILSDGDTVPATGMPKLPASISDVLVVGVGDPRVGTFIDGRQSRQDSGALRQIAARLNGTYHDANEKHLPSDLLSRLTAIPRKSAFERLTRREYALIASGLGASVLAILPVLLRSFGTRWRPGVPIQNRAIRRMNSGRAIEGRSSVHG